MPSCDEGEAEEPSTTPLSKKERKKMKRRKIKKQSQNLPLRSPQDSKATSPELREPLALKTVSSLASGEEVVVDTLTSGETSDISVTYTGAEERPEADEPSDQISMEVIDKKLVYEEAHNNTRISLSFEDDIEKLVREMRTPVDDSDGPGGSLASRVRKPKQKRKRRNKRKRTQGRQKHKHTQGSTRRRKISGNTPPSAETLVHAVSPQSIINEQKGETHLHFYISDPQPTPRPAMSVHQSLETNDKETPNQRETTAPSLPTKFTETSATGLRVTYHSFHPDLPLLSGSDQSEVVSRVPVKVNWNGSMSSGEIPSTVGDESSSARPTVTVMRLGSDGEFPNLTRVSPSPTNTRATSTVPPHATKTDDSTQRESITPPSKGKKRRRKKKKNKRSRRKRQNKWKRRRRTFKE